MSNLDMVPATSQSLTTPQALYLLGPQTEMNAASLTDKEIPDWCLQDPCAHIDALQLFPLFFNQAI